MIIRDEKVIEANRNDDLRGEHMTIERAKQLLFCTIQLLRQERMHAFSDWKDADDELFSDLDIEIGELEDIYDPYGVMVYGGSCFENGQSPKDYDVRYYKDMEI